MDKSIKELALEVAVRLYVKERKDGNYRTPDEEASDAIRYGLAFAERAARQGLLSDWSSVKCVSATGGDK